MASCLPEKKLIAGIFFVILTLMVSLKAEKDTPRFVILHLDGISSELFRQEYKSGNLPELERVFQDEGIIHHGLTLFPGETEMIVPRLRTGETSQTGQFVAWGHYDRETSEKTTKPQIFFHLVDKFPRRARTNFFYGLPVYHLAAGPALVNLADLVDDYHTVQFYWFSTDTFGHFLGEEGTLPQLYRFDHYFGKLERRLDEDVNIIIYADHGMTFSHLNRVDLQKEIQKVLEEETIAFFKPNLYLKNPETKPQAAQKLVSQTEIDFAFYRKDHKTVKGYYRESELTFTKKNEGIRYSYKGKDPFSYGEIGYDGEYLSPDEWLALTHEAQYPATPPLLYWYVQNPRTGDVVIILDHPNMPADLFYITRAHHAGLRDTDLSVPILLRGKEVEHLYDRDFLWLHRLYNKIPALDIEGSEPSREEHQLAIWGSHSDRQSYRGMQAYYSPAYRWRIGGRVDRRGGRLWGERDIFSSYLTRFWAGIGAQYVHSDLEPVMSLSYEMRYQQLSSRFQYFRSYRHQDSYLSLSWDFHPHIDLTWIVPKGIGLTFSW